MRVLSIFTETNASRTHERDRFRLVSNDSRATTGKIFVGRTENGPFRLAPSEAHSAGLYRNETLGVRPLGEYVLVERSLQLALLVPVQLQWH